MAKKQLRIALRNCGVIDPERIEDYIARDGYQEVARNLTVAGVSIDVETRVRRQCDDDAGIIRAERMFAAG